MPHTKQSASSQTSSRTTYWIAAILIGLIGISIVLTLALLSRPSEVNISDNPTRNVAIPSSVGPAIDREALSNPTEVGGQGTYSPGERIIFFEGDSMFMVKPDRTEQMVIYKSGDETFLGDNLESTLLRRIIWSPTGTAYAYTPRYDEKTRILDPFTQKISGVEQANELSWSPDGHQMVITYFSRLFTGSQLAIVTAEGADPKPMTITSSRVSSESPAWSPDGQRIAFVRFENFEHRIYTIRADGSDETALTVGMAPVWSPDGQSLLFYRDEPGAPGNLYRIKADGTDEVKIAAAPRPDRTSREYKWSPDGRKIAHLVPQSGRSGNESMLFVTAADGTEVLWSYNLVARARIVDYAWSPDSTRVLMLNGGDFIMIDLTMGTAELFIPRRGDEPDSIQRSLGAYFIWLSDDQAAVALAGLRQPRVVVTSTTNPTATTLPTLPPPGTVQLQPTVTYTPTPLPFAFETFTPTPFGGENLGGGNGKILISEYGGMNRTYRYYEFDLKSRTKTPLTIPETVTQLTSHPDGRYYVGTYTFGDVTYPVLINKSDFTIEFIPGIEQGHSAVPSPDGSQIAYVAPDRVTQIPRLWVVEIDGSNPHPVDNPSLKTKSTGGNNPNYSPYHPRWSPDGKRIAYWHSVEGPGQIWVVNLEKMTDERLFQGESPEWSPDGKSIAYMGQSQNLSVWNTGQPSNIYIADANGRNLRQFPAAASYNFVWSPDSQHLILDMSDSQGRQQSLYIANADGTDLTLLVSGDTGSVGIVEWETMRDPSLPTLTPRPAIPVVSVTPTPTSVPEGMSGTLLFNRNYETPYYWLGLQTFTETQVNLPETIVRIFLHPDGQHYVGLYEPFPGTSRDSGNRRLGLINQDDGTISPIPNIEHVGSFALSPDGSQIVFTAPDANVQSGNVYMVWIASIDGTNIRTISDQLDHNQLSELDWSPDGTKVIYGYNQHLRIIDLATLTDERLIQPDWTSPRETAWIGDGSAAWSPDGQYIAYVFYVSGAIAQIYVVNADGSNPHPITAGYIRNTYPAWSPDGSKIAFRRDQDIYMVNVDGSGLTPVRYNVSPTELIWTTLAESALPAPAPTALPQTLTPTPFAEGDPELGGGTGTIIFRDGPYSFPRFFELDLRTGIRTQLELPRSIVQIVSHPDGKRFAGTYSEGETTRLVMINRADWTISSIPNTQSGSDVAVSPDGSQIAYVVEDPGTRTQSLHIASIDGTNNRQISDPDLKPTDPVARLQLTRPRWSPDGTRIAYNAHTQVRVVDIETLTDQLLIEGGTSPDWSPDGQQIAYVSLASGQMTDIYVMNADGSNPHPITTGQLLTADPAWSPNGLHIVFGVYDEGIFMVNPDESNLARVLEVRSSPVTAFEWEAAP